MLSTKVTVITKVDLDNEVVIVLFICGSSGDLEKLFIGAANGWKTDEKAKLFFEKDKSFETTAGIIADFNNDGFNDVVLGGGGNEYLKGDDHFSLRYYLNDKNGGSFSYSINRFSTNTQLDEKLFNFNKEEYPEIEIIDLR